MGCSKASERKYTGMCDCDGEELCLGDLVQLGSMKGKVVFECGAYGLVIGCVADDEHGIVDWDELESMMPFNNTPCFCYNDNFISLWEIYWNLNTACDDSYIEACKIIGKDDGE